MGLPSTIPTSSPQIYPQTYIDLFKTHNLDKDEHVGRLRWLEETFQGTPRPAVDLQLNWFEPPFSRAKLIFEEDTSYSPPRHNLKFYIGSIDQNSFDIKLINRSALKLNRNSALSEIFLKANNLYIYSQPFFNVDEFTIGKEFLYLNTRETGAGVTSGESGIVIYDPVYGYNFSKFIYNENFKVWLFNKKYLKHGDNLIRTNFVDDNEFSILANVNNDEFGSDLFSSDGKARWIRLNISPLDWNVFEVYKSKDTGTGGSPITWKKLLWFDVDGNMYLSGDIYYQTSKQLKPLIFKPQIVYPTDGSTNVSTAVVIRASAYTIDTDLFQGLHERSQWQIATNPSFISIVADVLKTTGVLTELTPADHGNALNPNTTYYVRVRYGSDNHWSSWSDPVSFYTGLTGSLTINSITWSSTPIYGGKTYNATVNASGGIPPYQYRIVSSTCAITPSSTTYQSSDTFTITFPSVSIPVNCDITFEVIDSTTFVTQFTETVTIQPAGNPPVIDNISFNSNIFYEETSYIVTVTATDPDGDPLTYQLTTSEPNINVVQLSVNTFEIFIPSYSQLNNPGSVQIIASVTDGINTTTQTVTISVKQFLNKIIEIRNFTVNNLAVNKSDNRLSIITNYTSSTDVIIDCDYDFNTLNIREIPFRTLDIEYNESKLALCGFDLSFNGYSYYQVTPSIIAKEQHTDKILFRITQAVSGRVLFAGRDIITGDYFVYHDFTFYNILNGVRVLYDVLYDPNRNRYAFLLKRTGYLNNEFEIAIFDTGINFISGVKLTLQSVPSVLLISYDLKYLEYFDKYLLTLSYHDDIHSFATQTYSYAILIDPDTLNASVLSSISHSTTGFLESTVHGGFEDRLNNRYTIVYKVDNKLYFKVFNSTFNELYTKRIQPIAVDNVQKTDYDPVNNVGFVIFNDNLGNGYCVITRCDVRSTVPKSTNITDTIFTFESSSLTEASLPLSQTPVTTAITVTNVGISTSTFPDFTNVSVVTITDLFT